MKWFKTKTFLVRFLVAPVVFLWTFQANLNSPDAVAILIMVGVLGSLDRIAAWADRNVPDSNPDKYR